MASYAPITLRVVDETGHELFNQSVPFEFEIDVERVMERAFVIVQTAAAPDPLPYSLKYYGFSEAAPFPGYLGYEIESIFGRPTNNQFYWALSLDGVLSTTGADTTYPGPGATVLWQYSAVPVNPAALPGRTRVIHARRAARAVTNAP